MNVEIAQRLAELRRERGFSQEGLAEQLGLSRQAVSKWERAESAPDMGNLIALADLYEVTLDEPRGGRGHALRIPGACGIRRDRSRCCGGGGFGSGGAGRGGGCDSS